MSDVPEKVLDDIHEWVDGRMYDKDYDRLNTAMNVCFLITHEIDLDILMSFLTATLPVKSKLPHRNNFIYRLRCRLEEEHSANEVERILQGLK